MPLSALSLPSATCRILNNSWNHIPRQDNFDKLHAHPSKYTLIHIQTMQKMLFTEAHSICSRPQHTEYQVPWQVSFLSTLKQIWFISNNSTCFQNRIIPNSAGKNNRESGNKRRNNCYLVGVGPCIFSSRFSNEKLSFRKPLYLK